MSFESGGSSFRPFIPKVQGSQQTGDSHYGSGGLGYTAQSGEQEEPKVDEVVLSTNAEENIDINAEKNLFLLIFDYIKHVIEAVLVFFGFKKEIKEKRKKPRVSTNPF